MQRALSERRWIIGLARHARRGVATLRQRSLIQIKESDQRPPRPPSLGIASVKPTTSCGQRDAPTLQRRATPAGGTDADSKRSSSRRRRDPVRPPPPAPPAERDQARRRSARRSSSPKIASAIARAGAATGEFDARRGANALADAVGRVLAHRFAAGAPRHREDPGHSSSMTLAAAGYFNTARAYIVYRDQHARLRADRRTLVDVAASIDEYLEQKDWRVNANANQGYSLGGLILNVSGKVVANYWLSHVYAPEIGRAHRDGDVHIHDLDMLAGYCAGWSLRHAAARRPERRARQGRGRRRRSTCRAPSARSSTSSARCRTNGRARRRSARSTPTWRRSSAATRWATTRSSSASRS